MTYKTTPVAVICSAARSTKSMQSIPFRDLTNAEKVVRAVKRLAITWAVAGLAIVIPVAHFVLVPGLILLGPVVAIWGYKRGVVLGQCSVSCPKCSAAIEVLEGSPGWPLKLFCTGCGTPVDAAPEGNAQAPT